jgi:hypothetical protein
MREGTYVIRKGDTARRDNAALHIQSLDHDRDWRVTIEEYRKKRSLDQNAYIHAVPLKMMSDATGYTVEDIKTYLCGEFSGWTESEVFGRKRLKPNLHTSQMNTKQMAEFIEFLVWYGADKMGLTIPYPSEE